MLMIGTTKQPSKKYIKRILRKPHKAQCLSCHNKLVKIVDDANRTMFRCTNTSCQNLIDATQYVKHHTHNKVVDNQQQKVLIIRCPRLQNKYYPLDEHRMYNPVAGTLIRDNTPLIGLSDETNDELKKELLIRLSVDNAAS